MSTVSDFTSPNRIRIGVLALQGAFAEHIAMLNSLRMPACEVRAVEVKTVEELDACDALIIPGGESTSMRIISEDIMQALGNYPGPVWGTCAGCILLADRIIDKEGNQAKDSYGCSVEGLDIDVCRNYYGRQTASFQASLRSPYHEIDGLQCVFIRAPAILRVGKGVEIVGSMRHEVLQEDRVVCARQGRLMVSTFHPELTNDKRMHEFFVEKMVLTHSENK